MALSRKEVDELKPKISGIVEKVLGFSDSALVTAAIQCLQKDLDKNETVEQLQPLMDKSAKKFVEALFEVVEDVKPKKKNRKRKDDGRDSGATKKVRRFVEPEATQNPAVALPAEPVAESPGMLTTQQIKNMMEHARKQIEQRKEQLKMMNPADIRAQADAAKAANGSEQVAYIESTMSKADKAAELQRKIQEKLAARPGLLSAGGATAAAAISGPQAMASMIAKLTGKESTAEDSAPKPLILDDQGRTVDVTGQLLNIPQRVPTLKANIRAQKREEFRQKMLEKPQEETTSVNKYFDPRVTLEGPARQRKQFRFHDEGKYVQIAHKIRTKTQLEKLQNEIAQAARKTGIQQASKLALIAPKAVADSGQVPDLEWWDEYLIIQDGSSNSSGEKYHGITKLIEHPTQLEAPGQKKEVTLGLYLTKKERKKLRRLNRREAHKDEQEKIRLGLVPAPEPKALMLWKQGKCMTYVVVMSSCA